MVTIGDRIKQKRKELGLTQAELGQKLNVTDRAVSKWEQNEGNPDMSLIAPLANVLGVTLDYLITGKQEETISLDDMDDKKRLSWVIKRDDIDNFKKYSYHTSAYLFGREQDYVPNTQHGCNYCFKVTSLNLSTWKEIISNDANKIFNFVLDEMLEKNTKTRCWLAFTVYDCLDGFIKACILNDRADVLKALGVKFFKVGSNSINNREKPMLLGSIEYADDKQAYAMSEETLRLFFELKDKSPKCYKYITTFSTKDVTLQSLAIDLKATKESYVTTYLEQKLLSLAIKFKDFNVVKDLMKTFKESNEHVKGLLDNARDGGWTRDYKVVNGSYVIYTNRGYYSGPYPIDGRVYTYDSELINSLLLSGNVELAKEMINHNKLFNESIAKKIKNDRNADISAYVLTDKEIDRMLKLNSNEVSDEEKVMMHCVNEYIINVGYLKSLRDIKFIKEILDKYYLNYYELAYDAVSKNDLKVLFQILVDNNYNKLVDELLKGEENYEYFLKQCWRQFNITPNCEEYKEHKTFLSRQNKVDVSEYDNPYKKGNSELEAIKLGGNGIIDLIKAEKQKVVDYVEERLVAEKKAKEEAEERARIVKGLTREYFEELLSKGENEMFIIKLCALFDAYLRFDHHLEGEDLSERMNKYFAQMSAADPKSRDIDDGWGYMVLDQKYEDEVVIPAKNRTNHLSDIFNRLRIQRNNIAHSETRKVNELSPIELNECLDFVLPKEK